MQVELSINLKTQLHLKFGDYLAKRHSDGKKHGNVHVELGKKRFSKADETKNMKTHDHFMK